MMGLRFYMGLYRIYLGGIPDPLTVKQKSVHFYEGPPINLHFPLLLVVGQGYPQNIPMMNGYTSLIFKPGWFTFRDFSGVVFHPLGSVSVALLKKLPSYGFFEPSTCKELLTQHAGVVSCKNKGARSTMMLLYFLKLRSCRLNCI